MVRGLKYIIIFCITVLSINPCRAAASDIVKGIEFYKTGNFDKCITSMKSVVSNDPTDVMAYYYLALAYTKTGNHNSAIQNYDKVIHLNSDKNMTKLAKQGKSCLINKKITDTKPVVKDEDEDYNPILNDGVACEEEVFAGRQTEIKDKNTGKTDISKKQSNNMNESYPKNSYNPQKEPTNDDIVNAIRVLQKAGLLQNGVMGLNTNPNTNNNMQMDSRTQQMQSMLMMMNNGNNNNNMMQMMPYMNNGTKVDPQMMQMMLMQQMMPNFGGNNNNGY